MRKRFAGCWKRSCCRARKMDLLHAGSGEGRKMDKLFNKGWFIKLISLLIAVMLFLMVNVGNQPNQAGGIPGITDGSRVVEDVPLNVYYDEENYVLTEAPETVQVTMRGPQNVLTLSQITQGQQEVYIDLEGMEAGSHYERVEHRGFPSDLNISITPMTVSLTLEERATASYPVEVNLENVEEGMDAGEPVVEPSSVAVTSGGETVEEIDSAQVTIDMAGRTEGFTETADVVLYDESGNALDIAPDPGEVEVRIPLDSPHAEVPLQVNPPDETGGGRAISSVTLIPDTAAVYGTPEVLEGISSIEIEDVNWSDMDGDTTIDLEVPVPEGADRVEPESVTMEVNTENGEASEREFSGFPIEVQGLASGLNAEFPTLENNQLTLELRGEEQTIEAVSRSDIRAVVNLSGLSAGEHQTPLQITGPSGIQFPQNGTELSVELTDGTRPPEEPEEEDDPEPENGTEPENEPAEEPQENEEEENNEELPEPDPQEEEENTEEPEEDTEEPDIENENELEEDNNNEESA
ncbi:MAG: YbbR-like domain-containing protein [Alkalicoccus sp.]|nr:MAG: YbbR-like domain-containing protein [Alkalicoccus sp.]